ncbi:MAG: hypothetical protein ACREMU_00570, partial [Gemmatimonadaceae bacterium]
MRALVLAAIAGVVACSPAAHPAQPASPAVAPVRVESLPPQTVRMVPAAPAEAAAPRRPMRGDPFARLDRMDWPAPSRIRSADGRPGPDYWQQRADYEIAATLDTTKHTIRGHVSLAYTNNSPDTLR